MNGTLSMSPLRPNPPKGKTLFAAGTARFCKRLMPAKVYCKLGAAASEKKLLFDSGILKMVGYEALRLALLSIAPAGKAGSHPVPMPNVKPARDGMGGAMFAPPVQRFGVPRNHSVCCVPCCRGRFSSANGLDGLGGINVVTPGLAL